MQRSRGVDEVVTELRSPTVPHAACSTLPAPGAMRHVPRVTGCVLFALLIFTPLARASVQGWAVTTIHMVTLVGLAAFLLERILTWDWKWISVPLDKPILILMILCVVSTLFSVHRRTSLSATTLLVNYVVIFYLVVHTVRTRSQIRHLVYLIIGVATFLSILGLLKAFGANPLPWWEYDDLGQDLSRMTATFGNPDHLAGYMEMSIPLLLGLFLTGFRETKIPFLICLTFLLLVALIFSLSRGGWIGALVGLAFMAVTLLTDRHVTKKRLVVALAGGFLAVAFVVLASTPIVERIRTFEQRERTPNLGARITVWGGMMQMIYNRPLLGTGPGTFATVFTQYQPAGLTSRFFKGHNDYLHFTSEVGLPLVPIIVWMIIALYRKGLEKLKNPSRLVRGVTLGALSGVTAILVHSIVDFNLHIPSNALLFTVISALVVAPIPTSHDP